ncbi:MAG: hypothetical protein M1830_009274 [Pleopsidium flavum]|nr:MAG: hypothetical protein M1830_009274 [Pleopsidium flavum]
MADAKVLTDEVRRIVSAPYAVSLKHLRDIIDHVDKATLQRWADGHPCQIDSLARAVIDGLQLWPYVFSLLADFCHIVVFRNAVLQIKPNLLDDLLQKAVESHHGYQQYFSACVSMLSATLPEDTPIPASVPSFFLKVLGEAAQCPSALTIRPIYSMLAGVGPSLLEVLAEDAVVRFQEQLIRMLRSLDDQSANLLCLAIFARITTKSSCQFPTAESSSQESMAISGTPLPGQGFQYHAIQQFFRQKRAAKTLDLVVLRVIYACSNSSNISLDDALESLKLAKEIIDAVEREQKEEWIKLNGAKVRKMFEKTLRTGICPELQSLAFEVIISLVKIEDLPVQLIKAYRDTIRIEDRLIVSDVARTLLSKRAIESFAPRLDEAFIAEVLQSILKTAVQQSVPCNEFLRASLTAVLIVSAFAAAVQGSSKLRGEILFALSTNEFCQLLEDFIAIPPPPKRCIRDHCAQHGVCPMALAETQNHLRLHICSLFLRTALLASADQAGMNTTLAVSLLQKQADFSTTVPRCHFVSPYAQAQGSGSLSLVEQTSTPGHYRASNDWRTRLSSDLLRNATNCSDMIIRTVGEICRDLEDRCQLVEQPLREEQARSKDLEIRLDTSRARIATLESQAGERNLFLDGLDVEKARLKNQVQAGESRQKTLSNLLQEVESQFEQAKAEAGRSAAAAKEKANDQDLKHLAIMSSKDETIEEQIEQIAQLEQQLKDLREELTVTSEAKFAAQERVVALETRLDDGARAMELEMASSARKDSETEILRCTKAELKTEIEAVNEMIRQQATKIEALQTEVRSVKASSDETVEELKHSHESEKLATATEVTRLTNFHQEEVYRLNANVREATHNAALESREKSSKISELERKIERLLKQRDEKAREFAEAQDLSSKLMAVMGFKREQSATLHSNTTESETNMAPVDTPVGQHATRQQRNTESTQSFGSSTSSKSGSTPKRTRTRRNTKTPSIQQKEIELAARTIKAAQNAMSRSPRHPLKDLGVSMHNMSPVKTQRHGYDKGHQEPNPDRDGIRMGKQYDVVMDLGDLSFGGSDIFTSTEKELSPSQHEQTLLDDYDETTADF